MHGTDTGFSMHICICSRCAGFLSDLDKVEEKPAGPLPSRSAHVASSKPKHHHDGVPVTQEYSMACGQPHRDDGGAAQEQGLHDG